MTQDQRPEYLRIAAELRASIANGTYAPGDQLPTLTALAQQYDVSDTTVRNAIGILRNEGLVESKTRSGTRVRERPAIHRLAADRYRPRPEPSTPFTADQGTSWSEYHLGKRFERVLAVGDIAALFEEEDGLELLARHFVFYDGGVPSQMSTSYVRWADVTGSPIVDPINEPWPGGTRAQLATVGVHVTRVLEAFTAGMPTEQEAETLAIGPGIPVLRWTRRMLTAEGRVVEVAHPMVRRGDTTVVDFDIDVSGT